MSVRPVEAAVSGAPGTDPAAVLGGGGASVGAAGAGSGTPRRVGGWLPRAVLAAATGLLLLAVLSGTPGILVSAAIAGAGLTVVLAPGGYACGVLVATLAFPLLFEPATIGPRLVLEAALLPLVHVASGLARALPAAARVDRSALWPSLTRVGMAAATVLPVAGLAALVPAAQGSGVLLGISALAIAALVTAALVAGRSRR